MNDLISRKAALKAVDWDTEAYTAIINLPTIDPVKHGKWNICEGGHEPPDYMDAAVMECGVCGWITEYYGGLEEEWNYCPNCGSKVEEKK